MHDVWVTDLSLWIPAIVQYVLKLLQFSKSILMKSGFSNSHFHFACSTLESAFLLHFHGGGNFFLHCMETARTSTLKSPAFKKNLPTTFQEDFKQYWSHFPLLRNPGTKRVTKDYRISSHWLTQMFTPWVAEIFHKHSLQKNNFWQVPEHSHLALVFLQQNMSTT